MCSGLDRDQRFSVHALDVWPLAACERSLGGCRGAGFGEGGSRGIQHCAWGGFGLGGLDLCPAEPLRTL